jgi:hypothetical protein
MYKVVYNTKMFLNFPFLFCITEVVGQKESYKEACEL